jgi:CrcB protein
MKELIAVAVGGAFGSVLRYGLSNWVHALAGRAFPYGTLAVNVIGCLAMGFLFVLFVDRFSDNGVWRAGILIGVLGGFTTFSSFSIETFNLIEQGDGLKAVGNILASVFLCLLATWVGARIGRTL